MTAPQSVRADLATGLTAHALSWNNAAPVTVLLVHGFLDSGWGWTRVAERLAEHFHVLAPDMRGHGDSDRVGAGGYYYFFDYVADLASLVDQLSHPQLVLVGHSMGATIAAYYAGSFPERVAGLALLEGMGPPDDSDASLPDRVRAWISATRRARGTEPKRYTDVSAAAERLRQHDARLDAEQALLLAARTTAPHPDGGVCFKHDPLHLTRGPYPFRIDVAEQFWPRITCPVLLLEGAESQFAAMGGEVDRRARLIPNLRRTSVPEAGHMLQRHAPERVAQHILELCSGLASSATT